VSIHFILGNDIVYSNDISSVQKIKSFNNILKLNKLSDRRKVHDGAILPSQLLHLIKNKNDNWKPLLVRNCR
jgi:hypothetical protein